MLNNISPMYTFPSFITPTSIPSSGDDSLVLNLKYVLYTKYRIIQKVSSGFEDDRIMVGPRQHRSCLYQCPQCDYKNKNHFNLKYHLECHTRNQRFKCPLCSFSSHFKFYTDRHLELHHINNSPITFPQVNEV